MSDSGDNPHAAEADSELIDNAGAVPWGERFERFFELPLVGFAISLPDHRWFEVNDRLCEILGYSRDELIGSKWSDITHPEDLDQSLAHFNEALAGLRSVYSFEKRFIRKDESIVYTELSVGTVKGSTGRPEYFIVVLNDITDHTRNRAALEEQQGYLRQVIDTIPHQLFAKDQKGRFTFVNQASARWLGFPVEEIVGKTDAELNPYSVEVERFREQDLDVLSESRTLVLRENPLTSPSTGELRWFETIKKPLLASDGRPIQMVGISTDLTERKRTEDALRAILEGTVSATAENFFRSLVYHLAAVLNAKCAWIGQIDADNPERIISLACFIDGEFADEFGEDLAGTPNATVVGRVLQHYPEKVADLFPHDLFLKVNRLESYIGAPIFDSSGNSLGVLAVMDSKPMPEWPAQRWILSIFAARAGAEIERLRTEHEQEMLRQQLMRSQKMEAIGELAAGIAHDLNNSLTAVRGHLELIEMEGHLGDLEQESVRIALEGCARAGSLIEDLLGFSRDKPFKMKKLSLPQLVAQTTEFLGRVIGSQIMIETRGLSEELWVSGDSGQLQQSLTNLIINARQAMPEGGRLIFEYSTRNIEDAERYNAKASAGRYVLLSITDTGIGIPEDDLSRIFEPFFTTKEKEGGTGLGLPMVYDIVGRHSGWIDVLSKPGSGTTFTLFLPAADKDFAETAADEEAAWRSSKPLVLVIDDEPFLVELCLTFLGKSGFEAAGFTKPEEAVQWYQENFARTDLIILDMKMPGMNGEECFDQLRMVDSKAEIVIMSGYIQHEAVERLLKKGALHFFQKPVKYPELMNWLKKQCAYAAPSPS